MAASDQPQGYWCNFVDSVPEDLLCKSCTEVARQFTVTECCGESYCYTCIKDTQQEGKPCPMCGTENFSIYKQPKYQKRIENLLVFCSMKERGCVWSGKLEELNPHLDLDENNCQFVDSLCPLNCQKTIPRNKISQHVLENCVKRDYVCQHCGFKATYQEVVSIHIPECKYVALQCPNRCGVTCEREDMEDHMKICRLEEVQCTFEQVGCSGKFKRQEEDEHFHKHIPQHLTMTAAGCVRIREELQWKILEQDEKIKALEQKLQEQEKNYKAENRELSDKFMKLFKVLFNCSEKRFFKVNNYKIAIPRGWKSPVMYTHVGGYKFFIDIQYTDLELSPGAGAIGAAVGAAVGGVTVATTIGAAIGTVVGGVTGAIDAVSNPSRYLKVSVHIIQGEYDDELKWPARASFTIEIINQRGGENQACTIKINCNKPGEEYVDATNADNGKVLLLLREFSHNDTLCFQITNIICYTTFS